MEIRGNQTVSSGLIEGRIGTRASNRFLFFGSNRYVDRGVIDADVGRIRDIYEKAGFWAATVSAEVIAEKDDEARVRFHVEEGRPTIVRSLLVDGMEQLPDAVRARTLDSAPLVAGARYTALEYDALKDQILMRLRGQSYATARVSGRAEVSPEEGSADLVIEVEPGPSYRFGELEVEGNLLVPSRKIEKAAKVVLQPGDPYDPETLSEAEQEVFALGAFSSSVAVGGVPDPETARIPARLVVSEADAMRIRAGAGVGIEQGFQQVRGLLDFTHLSIFGGLQRLNLRNDIAYRFLFAEHASGFAGRSIAELTQPDLIGPRTDLALRFGYERQLTQSYTSQSLVARIGTPIRVRRWLYITPSYSLERFFNVQVFDQEQLARTEARTLTPLVDCPDGCTFSYLEQRLVADRRNSPLEPTSGWYASLDLQEGGGPLGGSFDWIRIAPEARWYAPIFPNLIFATRLELGYLQPLSTPEGCTQSPDDSFSQSFRCSPIVIRFFGGGSNAFRGLGAGRLAPQEAVEVKNGNGKTTTIFIPLGGNSSVLATAELRWFFAENLTSAFFVDAANVAAGSLEAFDLSALQYAAGVGIRYRSPIGPARLDVGYRFLRRPLVVVNDVHRFETNFFDWFAVFLAIGEAF
ncbi:Outer membrane protein [Vulgatibacter incomptus]|uniref:Outer membrane protein n=1 Tax=Vulgatibacter incomptus TaxID=1391653 RepID=A0A0K1PDW1_9BACT|nr:Outer membrane protein [Vulgatibacter incomptus]